MLSLHARVSSTANSSANYNGNLGFYTTEITRLLQQLVESYLRYSVDWLETASFGLVEDFYPQQDISDNP
jgi:hypothetical protein